MGKKHRRNVQKDKSKPNLSQLIYGVVKPPYNQPLDVVDTRSAKPPFPSSNLGAALN